VDNGGRTHSIETHPKYCVVTLSPAMNNCQWSEIEKVGNEVVRELEAVNAPNLVVDLSELEYIGSAMVALVVRIWKTVKTKNARMVVVTRNPMVLEVFKIAKLDEVWTIVEYREDALQELGISTDLKGEAGESSLLAVLALLAALAGAAVFGLHWVRPGGMAFNPILQMFGHACAIVGIVAGVVLWVNGTGSRRGVGIFATILSVAVALAGAYYFPLAAGNQVPNPNEPPNQNAPMPGENPEPAEAEKPPTPEE
jgi:anti-anti-sigma factor